MKSLLLSGKVKPDVGGQVIDIYNQSVMQGISPTLNAVMGNGGNNIPLFLIIKEI